MLKIFIRASSMGSQMNNELKMYRHMEQSPKIILVKMLSGSYLIHFTLMDLMADVNVFPVERLPSAVVAFVLWRLFLTLDYLHTECHVVHTDIKADNIMLRITVDSVFSDFEKELQNPVPRKEVVVCERTIYMSRDLRMPNDLGAPVLCDFGSAMLANQYHTEFVQPNIYRAPEVVLGVPWTYSVDMWNVGCIVWDIYEGGSLFTEFKKY
ncbi:serine/threonine protein kinase [Helicocarpus griseus UAMH5409]|uniref:Serine/threonine protein kinase n=1 Tax=Helicocarpus griseus UAMH5409 TaxID=1447875 RepID=A0A2B7WXS2_9EURO|nr:serine/threonine protein kinase [Helicocarpus griseus UAMH5409]